MKREDDYSLRRNELKNLSDEELKQLFWQLSERIVNPLIELARCHTTPSIERSVLLRMGFSSLEAKSIIEQTIENGMMGKGAGHAVYRLSLLKKCDIRSAGLMLGAGEAWSDVKESFLKGGI